MPRPRRFSTRVIGGAVLAVLAACGGDTSPPRVAVPAVEGLSLSAASKALEGVGLTVDTPSLQHSSRVPENHVIDQTPGAGDEVEAGYPISLVVSQGPSTPGPSVPDAPPVAPAPDSSR